MDGWYAMHLAEGTDQPKVEALLKKILRKRVNTIVQQFW